MLILSKNQIKFIKSLHQKKYRYEHQMFLLEGEKLVNEALRDKPDIVEYLIVQEDYKVSIPSHISVYFAKSSALQTISALESPPPVMAVCHFLNTPKNSFIQLENTFSFYLDNINDPGNLGTIIRVCDWFGIKELYCSPNTVDLYNSKTIQASKGSFLRVKVLYSEFHALHISDKTKIYAADLIGESIYTLKDKNGLIILGNEAHGISDTLNPSIHQYIHIPRYPGSKAESLNVAMSASIIANEFVKKFL